MKFLCVPCDQPMALQTTDDAGPGAMAIVYACAGCGHRIAMVTNPGETQLVRSLGVQIGHERVAPEPMGVLRGALADGRELGPAGADPVWTEAAERRLAAAPGFVQGMVRRLYNDWARENGVTEITPQVMNQARDALGLEMM
jgi:hypothetical protein